LKNRFPAHVSNAKGHLFRFGEKVVHVTVEHAPDDAQGKNFLGNDLGRVEHVEIEFVREFLVEQREAKIVFREISLVNVRFCPDGRGRWPNLYS
jgi:hypothetical protein